MALQLSTAKPRHLEYAAGGLRSDLRLIELDDSLLDSIRAGDVVIKGAPQQDAVLCTSDKTFALKVVETTNTLLLLPPQQDLDEDFAAIPSLATPGRTTPDASAVRDVGLQTQLQKSAAAKEFPALTATATAGAHLELSEIMPCLDKLPDLLGRPYSLEDEDSSSNGDGGQQAGGMAAMDTEMTDADADAGAAAAGPGSSRPQGCYTLEELLQQVQASRAELVAELQRLQAVQLGPFWRLVDPAYLGSALEMLVASAMERGWDLSEPIPLQEAVAALQPEGYKPAITQHCLAVYGSVQQQDNSSSTSTTSSTSSSSYRLDERAVCLHFARKLLKQRTVWPLFEFLPAWQQEVPGDLWCPQEDMLAGEALVQQPDPSEGFSEPRVLHFSASQLPSAPAARFAALFAVQPRWTREQLDPYLAGLRVPGQTVEMLLLKHARASQRSPTDATVVFVAR